MALSSSVLFALSSSKSVSLFVSLGFWFFEKNLILLLQPNPFPCPLPQPLPNPLPTQNCFSQNCFQNCFGLFDCYISQILFHSLAQVLSAQFYPYLAYYHLVFYLHLPFFLPVFGPFPFGPVPSLLGINFTPVL